MLHPTTWGLLALFIIAAIAPTFGNRHFAAAEALAARFAARKRLAALSVAALVILIRVATLPVSPAPIPAVHDEFSYLLASDTFAHGRLTNPPHPLWIFFDTFHVLQQPTYMSIYPPAQGFALAAGQLLGHPWIGVLLSVALMSAALTWMLQGWFPPVWALLGGTIISLRLIFTYWTNSYWGGAVAAIGGALVLGALPRILHHRRPRHAFILALGAALLANSRAVEGLIFCLPVAAVLLFWFYRQRASPANILLPRVILPVAAAFALMIAFMGYYNFRITGHPLLFPHILYQRAHYFPLLSWEKPNPSLHYANPQFEYFYHVHLPSHYSLTLSAWWDRSWRKTIQLWQFFLGLNLSLPLIMLPWVVRDRRIRLLLLQFLLSGAAILAVVFIEPHYAAPLLATITAIWLQCLRHFRRLTLFGRPFGLGFSRVLVLMTLGTVPWNAASTARPDLFHNPEWSASRARMAQQLSHSPGLHLAIIRYHPDHNVHNEWVYNAADIDHSKIVWAREIPGRDLQPLLNYFHDRTVWLVEADATPPKLSPYGTQARTN